MTSGVAVFLLGNVGAHRASGPVSIPGLKLQALLALLALSAPGPVSDGRLIDELWGDEPLANPANSLQAQVAILRRVLGRDTVPRVGQGYALAVEADDVDSSRLVHLVERARQLAREGDQRSAAQSFHTAIGLVQGPPLGELSDFAFAREAAARLGEVILAAHEGLADAELAAGRHTEQIVPLTELVRLHPLRERFHAQLMLSLYRSGRQADALRAYNSARATLIDELGLEPGPELRELERAVLVHDPGIAAPTEATSEPRGTSPDDSTRSDAPRVARADSFVGRTAEFDHLRSDLDDTIAGRGRVALVAGEPGIGKTRLAEELAADASNRGAVVAWGRCHGGRGAPAFWPWIQVLQAVIPQLPAQDVVSALGRSAADISQLVPEIHDFVSDLAAPTPSGPDFERFRLCDALAQTFRRIAERRPLVIVIEDLHWGDPSTLDMLTHIASAALDAPLMVVATYRNVGAPAVGPLADTLGELARQPVVQRVDLTGLDEAAAHSLIAGFEADVSADLVRSVHRRTQGNPFFLIEILRLRAGSADIHDLESVPTGVREVIRQRLRLLPDATVDVLAAASVLGPEFELSTLCASIELDVAAALEQLEPAFGTGLVTAPRDRPGRCRFAHVLLRDTLYEELGVARRARLHQRAAEAMEAVHGVVEGPHLFALAEHWFHAVPVAAPDRGIEHALSAARWAQRHVAHTQAEEQLHTALVLIEAMPPGQRRSTLELEVQYELSMLLVLTSGFTSPELDRTCNRMRELCEAIDDQRTVVAALWRVSNCSFVSGDVEEAIEIAEQILALAQRDGDPSIEFTGHMALGMLHTHRGNQTVARRHNDAASALREAGGDGSTRGTAPDDSRAWVWLHSAMNLALLGEYDLAEQAALDAVDVARALGRGANIYAITCATWIAAVVATIRGDFLLTRSRCEEGIAIATDQGYGTMFIPFLEGHLGWAICREGDAEAGLALVKSSADGARASGAVMWSHLFPTLAADACLAHRRFADALTYTNDGLAALAPGGERWYEAELHRLRGEALAGLNASDPQVGAECALAIEVAERQGATGLLRRAETSRERLLSG